MDNIRVIKTGINVSKIKRQLEEHASDWNYQKGLENASVLDPDVYGSESRTHYCGVYAHGMGAAGFGLFYIGAANIVAHLRRYWFIGSRLDVFSARRALFERVNHRCTGITASLKW